MKKAIIYTRVSTDDQNVEMQLKDLREYAQRQNFDVIKEYTDTGSGGKNDRENYKKLFEDVRKKRCDIVLVWKFDRFSRSTKELIKALDEFQHLGIDFISYMENIDTSSPMGKMLFTLISAFAEFERATISERVKAGVKNARAKGKQIGRPTIPKWKINKIEKLYHEGKHWTKIVQSVGISKSKYFEIVKSLDSEQ